MRFDTRKGESKMSVDGIKEESRTESSAESTGGQEPNGKAQPPTSYSKEEVLRIGTKEDTRGAGDGESGSTPGPREKLRDGT
jgi:hypothetical protein